jgi:methylenetetrahydrofolate dehydrogenase (NADP+)/methenyltetrahydrofolate cyclohydrolase
LDSITNQAEILIAAIGSPAFVTRNMVRSGAVVIDVGISRVADSGRKRGYRLVGDVDLDDVLERASAISPVPGGVGPMTVAMLLVNTVDAAERRHCSSEEAAEPRAWGAVTSRCIETVEREGAPLVND